MPLLHFVQSEQKYISNEAIEWIAEKLEIEPIKRYLASVRRVPITEKELGKGSTEYTYVSAALLWHCAPTSLAA